jgi:hypothetical protein
MKFLIMQFLQPSATSFLFGPNIFLHTLYQTPSIDDPPLMSEIKFYTHTEPINFLGNVTCYLVNYRLETVDGFKGTQFITLSCA